ncbi:hypothetical protein AB0K48_00660 [Nonomuraea sp. NPDC055795]
MNLRLVCTPDEVDTAVAALAGPFIVSPAGAYDITRFAHPYPSPGDAGQVRVYLEVTPNGDP